MSIEIRKMLATHDRTAFRCGDPDLDRYFQRFAGQHQFRHHVGVTYVALLQGRIVGFATVAAAEVVLTGLPPSIRKKLPPFPLPGLRLARLAVEQQAQGQGIGTALLRFCLALALRMRDDLGCVGVVVDSKATAVDFYEHVGFMAVSLDSGDLSDRPVPIPMFLPINAIG